MKAERLDVSQGTAVARHDEGHVCGSQRGEQHHSPSGLAVADYSGFAFRFRMELDHALEKSRLGSGDVLVLGVARTCAGGGK